MPSCISHSYCGWVGPNNKFQPVNSERSWYVPHPAKPDAPVSLPSHSDKYAYELTFWSHSSEKGGTAHPLTKNNALDYCSFLQQIFTLMALVMEVLFVLLIRIDLQSCVSFRCTAKWFRCIYMCVCVCVCVFFFRFFSIRGYYKISNEVLCAI